MRFGPDPRAGIKAAVAHYQRLADALAEAIRVTRQPDKEAIIWLDDMADLTICLVPLLDVLEVFETLDAEKSKAEMIRTGRGIFELKNGSAIILKLKDPAPQG